MEIYTCLLLAGGRVESDWLELWEQPDVSLRERSVVSLLLPSCWIIITAPTTPIRLYLAETRNDLYAINYASFIDDRTYTFSFAPVMRNVKANGNNMSQPNVTLISSLTLTPRGTAVS